MDKLIQCLQIALDDFENWESDKEWVEVELTREEVVAILEKLKA